MGRKPSCATTKLMLFTVSKNERNTKEDAAKQLNNWTYCGKLKGMAEATLNSEKSSQWP